jgi:hypothetical protein
MSENSIGADRRSFLKAGAIVAVPFAAAAPVAAFAADDRLARLEDERTVEALQRKFLRHLNGAGDCGEFIASPAAVDLGEGLRAIAEDGEAQVEVAEDGMTANARCPCRVARERDFTGDSTLEQMARFQGHGSHRHEDRRVLATEFVKGRDGWRIAAARLA